MKFKALISNNQDPSLVHYLDSKASETADLFLFVDELFDSLNARQTAIVPGKKLRSVVTVNSNHVNFWVTIALPLLKSMYFANSTITPSIKN